MSTQDNHGSIAVSLHYDGSNAPTVSAKGEGGVAAKILALAEENDVPIYQDTQLLQLLSRVDLDSEVPPFMYVAVAEIIAFAYRLKGQVPKNYYYRHDSGTVYQAEDDSEREP